MTALLQQLLVELDPVPLLEPEAGYELAKVLLLERQLLLEVILDVPFVRFPQAEDAMLELRVPAMALFLPHYLRVVSAQILDV